MNTLTFPAEFTFGVSTSSYQIEGGAHADGRGESIWDRFSRQPGRVFNGDTGDVACDHYHRLDSDLDLIQELGVGVYRFSIAWPRIQPQGSGPANRAGIDFYRRLVQGLRVRGICPVATLYHWDLPQALQDRGGWANRDIVGWFADYARVVVDALGESVPIWTTINEPWVIAHLGYRLGMHAPGAADEDQAAAAHHHLLLAHAAAAEVIRRADQRLKVGIALNMSQIYPISESPDDAAAVAVADSQLNGSFLQPLFQGRYPVDLGSLSARWQEKEGIVRSGDLARIKAPMDFLSVNTYHPRYVCAPGNVTPARAQGFVGGFAAPFSFGLPFIDLEPGDAPRTDLGWVVGPHCLKDLLLRLHRDQPDLPLYVSENGAAYADYVDPEGRVKDDARVAYLDGHLRAAHAALAQGVNLRGYWAWSLMDNFEWSFGYSKRFGLLYVDYPTGNRIRKTSFHWYQQLTKTRVLLKPNAPAA
jgi:beta-glucosidase